MMMVVVVVVVVAVVVLVALGLVGYISILVLVYQSRQHSKLSHLMQSFAVNPFEFLSELYLAKIF